MLFRTSGIRFVSSFGGKLTTRWDRIRAGALDRAGTLIVPITGRQIEQTLVDGEDAERFFKRLVRDKAHLRIF